MQWYSDSNSSSLLHFFITTALFTLSLSFFISYFGEELHDRQVYFRLGMGVADITGPIGEINMMGYGMPEQLANGIHTRLKARAYIFASPTKLQQRIVYVVIETGMASNVCKQWAIVHIQKNLTSHLYNEENIMLHPTHTHSGPGGYVDDFLYHLTSLGVVDSVREAIARGIAEAILMAHYDFEQAYEDVSVTLHQGPVHEASINRSPQAYDANPKEERDQYPSNVDNDMILLLFKGSKSKQLKGSINWFPVHPTSMNNKNVYVSSDNKGYAAYMWELDEKLRGNTFVAAFSQSHSGDVSPNIEGPRCEDTGDFCDGTRDACGGDVTKCYARGPGYDEGGDFASTKIIGKRQYSRAKKLAAQDPLLNMTSGGLKGVDYRHVWVNMTDIPLNFKGKSVKTCKPAMGHAFAAGTTDGPGSPLAFQGANSTSGLSRVLNLVRDVVKQPSQELTDCHLPKQIFVATGEIEFPYRWQPDIVPLQLFLLGPKFAIIGLPAEITTMAGRRLKKAVFEQLHQRHILDEDAHVVISALSNMYSSYVTTYEEYQVQRYEGGSTIYGPHTLLAYMDQFTRLAESFYHSSAAPRYSRPPLPIPNEVQLLPSIVLDTPPFFKWYGDIHSGPDQTVYRIGEKVKVKFHCAHPRNQETGVSFMYVEKFVNGQWLQMMTDAEWDTKFYWERKGAAESMCTCEWSIGETLPVSPGLYRIRYQGRHKILNYIGSHQGTSESFEVVESL